MRQTSSREHVRAGAHGDRRANQKAEANTFQDLVATARHLQGPTGCPWDRAQTVSSLLPHLIEEVWEASCAAVDRELVGGPANVSPGENPADALAQRAGPTQ